MLQFKLYKDQIQNLGEVERLGIAVKDLLPEYSLPKDYDGWFPFTRLCFSLGDWAVVSGLPEALKKKYPKIKIALPSRYYLKSVFGDMIQQWAYGDNNPFAYIDHIFKNNPYIDYRFNPGDFDIIYTDHDRAYTEDINIPLAEQILLRFGLTQDDLNNIDSRPSLYFEDSEDSFEYSPKFYHLGRNQSWHLGESKGTKVTSFRFDGYDDYGCLLFASRIKNLKGRWDDKSLLQEARKYKDTPVYYYSEFDLNGTEWDELFPYRLDLSQYNLREQLYIKSKAKFNIGYQAGINDAVSRYTDNIILTPYDDIKENIIRKVNYIHFDGTKKLI